jgi:CheY-like chemotaxis protein
MPHDIEKGLEVGFFRYLTKPIKVNELLETLDIALDLAETKLDGASNASCNVCYDATC